MFKDIAFYLFAMIAIINTIHLGYIAGANLYDIKQFFRKRKISKTIRRKYRPLVTIIVPAHNEEVRIIKTLESIEKIHIVNYKFLVVDDASSDATRSLVWRYIQLHPNRNIHLLRKQKNVVAKE
ncbi:MAG: glycosyltransferase [Candidatus Saccharimonadales bacterium]